MLPNQNLQSPSEDTRTNRRFSLFATNVRQISPSSLLASISDGGDSGSGICQRCKNSGFDLISNSGNHSASDSELRASRQVISLLQRQLELLRVEKEGLEELLVPKKTLAKEIEDEEKPSHESEDIGIAGRAKTDFSSVQSAQVDEFEPTITNSNTKACTKDEEIIGLRLRLKASRNEKEQLMLQIHSLEEDNAKLRTENSVLKENISLRDQTIVSLSSEVFEQGNSGDYGDTFARRQSNAETAVNQKSLFRAQRHIAKLIETMDAYKKTNELLSNNVMRLTERCTQAERKEIETRSQCQELEAKCCQIQSKLLSLLKEIEQSTSPQSPSDSCETIDPSKKQDALSSESVKILIKRLLEDKSLDIPLSWKEGNRRSKEKSNEKNSGCTNECDDLGFYLTTNESKDNDANSANITSNSNMMNAIQPNSSKPYSRFKLNTVDESIEASHYSDGSLRNSLYRDDESRWHVRWDNFIKDFDKVDLSKSKEFKILLRSGVPQEYRCKVWKTLVDLKIGKERSTYGPDYYQSLLQPNRPNSNSKKSLNPSYKQIELDLLRTLPNNKHFENLDSSGTVRLRRVLTAYSEHNPKVGYCQGMNRLAAVALLILPEEEAFWCLSSIVDKIMPTGYYNDLWLAQVDSSVVMDFISIKMPNLSDHFKENGVDLSLFAWFLTIFVDGTPPVLFLRLWDSFLFEGDKILFRVALALMKMYETDLMRLNNSVTINNFLRSSVNAPLDIDAFFDIAFDWINPLSSRSIRTKRQQNLQNLRSSFDVAGKSSHCTSSTGSASDDEIQDIKNNQQPYEESSIISI